MTPENIVLELFPIPIYISTLESLTIDTKKLIVNQEFEIMHSNTGSYSTNKTLLNIPELENIKKEIDWHVEYYTSQVLRIKEDQKFFMTTSWAVKHKKGNFAGTHLHTNSLVSGVFYLYSNKNYGCLTIQKHFYNLFTTSLMPDFSEYNRINSTEYNIESEENRIILFPSHTLHSVSVNNSNYTRYSVAFNYFANGIFGHKESFLQLT